MYLVLLDRTSSSVHSSSPTLDCDWNDPLPPPTQRLKFCDDDTEDLTLYHNFIGIGTSINGNLTHEARFACRQPTKAAQNYHKEAARYLRRVNWATMKRAVSTWVEDASFEVEARINQAFEGRDVCEVSYKVTDLIPSFTLPTIRDLSQTLDSLCDNIQALFERIRPEPVFDDETPQDMQWVFTAQMGGKVRRSLVEQGICTEWQVTPSRDNLKWQLRLNQVLAQIFHLNREQWSSTELMKLQPVWVADPAKDVWRLEFDTSILVLENRGDIDIDTPENLRTWFELPDSMSRVSVQDYCRTTRTVDDEWELFE